MKNLATVLECDHMIALELDRAGIDIVYIETPLEEVPCRLGGRLGPVTFARDWAYWVAEGPIPLTIAHELYADPAAHHHVRVHGQPSSTPPDAPWVRWYTSEGTRVYPVDRQAELLQVRQQLPNVVLPAMLFHSEPTLIGAQGYIERYHIDSIDGLQIFANVLRQHGIDRVARPVWWKWHHPATPDGTIQANVQIDHRRPSWDADTQEQEIELSD